jgi:hypothetical protein
MLSHVDVRLRLLFLLIVFVRQCPRVLAAENSGQGFGLVQALFAFEAHGVNCDAAMGVDLNFKLFSGHAKFLSRQFATEVTENTEEEQEH